MFIQSIHMRTFTGHACNFYKSALCRIAHIFMLALNPTYHETCPKILIGQCTYNASVEVCSSSQLRISRGGVMRFLIVLVLLLRAIHDSFRLFQPKVNRLKVRIPHESQFWKNGTNTSIWPKIILFASRTSSKSWWIEVPFTKINTH